MYPTRFQTGWSNIIHLTAAGDCCDHGTRIPAVWFHPSNSTATKNRLRICSSFNSDGNHLFDTDFLVPVSQWTTVLISQLPDLIDNQYRYTIKVANVQVYSLVNSNPREFQHVQVFISSPWSDPAQGRIRKLTINPYAAGKFIK